jgi:hypothetical protein
MAKVEQPIRIKDAFDINLKASFNQFTGFKNDYGTLEAAEVR